MTNNSDLLLNINDLIIEKLSLYSKDVRELALLAIRLSESLPEASVAEGFQTEVRKRSRPQGGGGQ